MSAPAFSHFVFVDLENVPDPDLRAVQGYPVHVTLVIGKNQKKLGIELTKAIHALAAQVALVEVGASGHNALDLVLANRLGRAVERLPAAGYHIISRDTDFDPLVAHLREHGTVVSRQEAFASLPFLSPPAKAAPAKSSPAKASPPATSPARKTPVDRFEKIVARLQNPSSRNRPSTRTRLSAYLKTALGPATTDSAIQSAIDRLRNSNVLAIDPAGKISYPS